ncbi:hypothetical protein [Cellulomonas sp. P5_C6]
MNSLLEGNGVAINDLTGDGPHEVVPRTHRCPRRSSAGRARVDTRLADVRAHLVHNWSWEATVATVLTDFDVLAAPHGFASAPVRVAAGDSVTLGAWDVLVAVTR